VQRSKKQLKRLFLNVGSIEKNRLTDRSVTKTVTDAAVRSWEEIEVGIFTDNGRIPQDRSASLSVNPKGFIS
jgi:hypothetical protein